MTNKVPERIPTDLLAGKSGKLEVLSHRSYRDQKGVYHIVGEVKNTGTKNLISVEVTARLYDKDKKPIGFAYTFTPIQVLLPRQKSPFEIISFEKGEVETYNLKLNFGTTFQKPYSEIEIVEKSEHTDEEGSLHVVGVVKNTGNQNVGFIKIVGTFYDTNEEVIFTSFVYTEPKTLDLGKTARFDVSVPSEISNKIVNHSIQIECIHGLHIVSPKW
jgi:hypothetical protein